jgi:TrmH family RNA methyltransferase
VRALFPTTTVYSIDARSEDLFATDHPQGVAAIVSIPRQPLLQDLVASDQPILVLDGVADPGNLGTIVRSAEWFGIAAVVLVNDCADAFNAKAVRASMGAVVRVPILESTSDEIVAADRPLYVLDTGATRHLGTLRLDRRALFVVGSEAHGASDAFMNRAVGLSIRGAGAIESLNAAIAASILCYELMRADA